MAFGWPNWVQAFLTPDEADNVKLLKISPHPILGAWALAILKSSKNKCEALSLIKDLCSTQAWQDELAKEGIVPVYNGFSNNSSILNHSLFWKKNAWEIKNVILNSTPRPRSINWESIEDQLGKQIIQSLKERANLLEDKNGLFKFRMQTN